jgi:hypothetical protein
MPAAVPSMAMAKWFFPRRISAMEEDEVVVGGGGVVI